MNPQIFPDTILQRNPDQMFTIIDDEVVMLNIASEEYLNLNSHASYIWQQLEFPCTFDELISRSCIVFDVERDICIEDTHTFIQDLIEKDIIQIINETFKNNNLLS